MVESRVKPMAFKKREVFHSRSVPKERNRRSFPLLTLVLLFALALTLTLLTTGVSAKETKPKLQPWHIPGIEAALEDDRPKVKAQALDQLAGYESQDIRPLVKQETIQKIASLLKDEKQDSDVRGSAAGALGNLGNAAKPYISDMVNLLKDTKQDPNLRYSAAAALGNLGNAAKSYIPDLLSILKDDKQDSQVRSGAVEALGNLGDTAKPYILDIANLLRDTKQDSQVRSSAARALGNLGDAAKPYIPDLINLLKDYKQDSQVRYSAASALGNLGNAAKPYIPDLINFIKDYQQDSYMRGSAVEALGDLGDAAKPYILDIANLLKDDKQDSQVRSGAARALGNLGEVAKPYIPDIANLLKDNKQTFQVRNDAAVIVSNLGDAAKPYILDIFALIKDDKQHLFSRSRAAEALGNLGDTAKPHIPAIINLLKDNKQASEVRSGFALALGKLEKLNFDTSILVLNLVYEESTRVGFRQYGASSWRFNTYFFSGGDEDVKRLLKWVGKPKQLPDQLNHDEGVKTLAVLKKAWDLSKDFPDLRDDLANNIARVAKMGKWQAGDIALLQQHHTNLKDANSPNADSVQAAISSLTVWQWILNIWTTILTHAAFWLSLVFAYPKSPQIQAIFFWNPWVRNILGFGYVSFLLTWIPFLRRKLFAPFRFSLLADAGLNHFHPDAYFSESNVRELGAGDEQPILQVIPEIKGQVILEGDSGLGKTMFLRHLLQQSKRIVVYLPATKCAEGVIEAIQKKLHGDEIKDTKFLQSLIYSGAIDICIDGLNEVNPDTRAKITQFVESHFKGNILMTTQPLEWLPPSTAKTYIMQPLQSAQIERYLRSRQPLLPKAAPVQGTAYEQACRTFLGTMLSDQTPLSPEELKTARTILSNPMELTLAAWMLAGGVQPDLFNLRQQQYGQMAEEYRRTWNQDFPLKQFSEAVYQQWLVDQKALPADKFYNELLCMEDEKFRMVVSRQWKDAKGDAKKEWYFRHDKIAEFFLVQTFLGKGTDAEVRLLDHIGDSRFRGVYFLLATLMDLEAAKDLREKLIQYAADTKDHTVSDTFVQLFRSRV